jgi:hypothetical protein
MESWLGVGGERTITYHVCAGEHKKAAAIALDHTVPASLRHFWEDLRVSVTGSNSSIRRAPRDYRSRNDPNRAGAPATAWVVAGGSRRQFVNCTCQVPARKKQQTWSQLFPTKKLLRVIRASATVRAQAHKTLLGICSLKR